VEEVCVAGESPGRAEQQESSGEATERRTEDPRLAAFRGAEEAEGSSGAGNNDSVTDREDLDAEAPADPKAGGDGRTSDATDDVTEADKESGGDTDSEAESVSESEAAAAEETAEETADEAADEAPGEAAEDKPEAAEGKPEAPEAEPQPREGTLVLAANTVAEMRASIALPEAKPVTPLSATPITTKPVTPKPLPPKPPTGPAGPVGTFVPLVTDETPSAPRESTKQMPLPPTPGESLKLLAELTNTPPPPETPLRTVARRFKIWTPLVLLLVIVFGAVQAVRPLPDPQLKLTAASAYTFSGSTPSLPWPTEGQAVVEVEGMGTLGSYGQEKPVPIASVAKVMTAYVILRDHPIKTGAKGETITVDQKAADQYKSGLAGSESVVKVTQGQQLTEYEALEAVLLASANNVARLLARWDAGSESAFVAKMNAAAKELGMTNTTYTDPSGLQATTVSTARDQVKLGRNAMQSSAVFQEIATKIEYTDSAGTKHKNWNQLAGYNGVVGIKTGTSTKAGGNLLFAATKKVGGTERLIIGATLGQYVSPIITTVLNKSQDLIRATQGALKADTIIKKGEVVGYVDDGLGGHTAVVTTKDVTAAGWSGLKVGISLAADTSGIPHKATSGTTVGTLTVGNGSSEVKVPVALQSDLAEPGFGTKLTRIA
jgi:D-alanyl-D-alanine carboxypeptidase